MCPVQPQKEEMVLSSTSSFRFACHDNLPCFTQCCRDVNIYLTPYDVLRLRRALKMGSGEFLAKYTRYFLAKVTHIPVVQLAMDPDTLYCRLVRENGCSVYQDRPWACRMYPLDLGSEEGSYCMVAGSGARCLGLSESRTQTVSEWLESQGVEAYTEMEHVFHSVMPPNFKPGQRLEAGLGKILFLAYDLDRFAEMLNDKHFQNLYGVDEAMLQGAQESDEELLNLAFRYIRSQLEELLPVAW